MNRNFSLYLDAVRFLAAVTVLISHWAYRRFTGGELQWIRDFNFGSDAVVAFFVLSGLVIAFAADERDRVASTFAFNRITRLVSVAAPALLLAFVLDRLGAYLNPVAYDGWWYNDLGLGPLLWKGLTFSSEWSIPGTRLGTNGPYWSLSYEAAYYVLFGAAFFLTGARRVLAVAAVALIVGIKVLLLLPVWLLGVALWMAMRRGGPVREPRLSMVVLAVAAPVIYGWSLLAGVPQMLWAQTVSMSGVDAPVLKVILGFSDEFAWNFVVGLLVAIHLRAVWRLTREIAMPIAEPVQKVVRWLAGASFSIYLVHYPVMQLAGSVLPADLPARGLVILLVVLAVCFLFAEAFERPLFQFRGALRRGRAMLGAGAREIVPATAPVKTAD